MIFSLSLSTTSGADGDNEGGEEGGEEGEGEEKDEEQEREGEEEEEAGTLRLALRLSWNPASEALSSGRRSTSSWCGLTCVFGERVWACTTCSEE